MVKATLSLSQIKELVQKHEEEKVEQAKKSVILKMESLIQELQHLDEVFSTNLKNLLGALSATFSNEELQEIANEAQLYGDGFTLNIDLIRGKYERKSELLDFATNNIVFTATKFSKIRKEFSKLNMSIEEPVKTYANKCAWFDVKSKGLVNGHEVDELEITNFDENGFYKDSFDGSSSRISINFRDFDNKVLSIYVRP